MIAYKTTITRCVALAVLVGCSTLACKGSTLKKIKEALASDNKDAVVEMISDREGRIKREKMHLLRGQKNRRNEKTLLHIAAREGAVNTIQWMLEMCRADNIDIANLKDKDDSTPLHLAARHGKCEVAEKLMEAAKELATARDKKGCIALHLALENHLSEQVEEQTKTDRERLISCLLPTNLPTDTVLKMVRARTGLQRGRGYTAVHLAAQNGTLKAMLYILEKGEGSLKLDNLAENNCTLLHLAVKGKQSAIARKLLQKAEESTSEASCEGPTLFKALLSPDADGRSPLHQAVIEGHPQLVEFLVEKGADFNAKDKSGCTPLDLLRNRLATTPDSPRKREAITEIEEYLLSKNAESNQPKSQQRQQLLKKFKDLSKNITLTLSAGPTGVNISLAVNNLGSICCGGEPDVSF